jgi:hypothetical protein
MKPWPLVARKFQAVDERSSVGVQLSDVVQQMLLVKRLQEAFEQQRMRQTPDGEHVHGSAHLTLFHPVADRVSLRQSFNVGVRIGLEIGA